MIPSVTSPSLNGNQYEFSDAEVISSLAKPNTDSCVPMLALTSRTLNAGGLHFSQSIPTDQLDAFAMVFSTDLALMLPSSFLTPLGALGEEELPMWPSAAPVWQVLSTSEAQPMHSDAKCRSPKSQSSTNLQQQPNW
jgi:hypothetical protein